MITGAHMPPKLRTNALFTARQQALEGVWIAKRLGFPLCRNGWITAVRGSSNGCGQQDVVLTTCAGGNALLKFSSIVSTVVSCTV